MSTKSRLILVVFVYGLSVVGAFQLGKKSLNPQNAAQSEPTEGENEQDSNSMAQNNVSGDNSQLPPSLAARAGLAPQKVVLDPFSPESYQQFQSLSLNDILQNENKVDHLFQLAGYLKNLDENNIDQVLATFEENAERSTENYRDWTLFINSWSEFDPEGAMAYLVKGDNMSKERQYGLASEAIRNWAKTDPMKALEFAQNGELGKIDGNRMVLEAINTAARTDLATALTMAEQIQDDKTRIRSTATLADRYFKENPDGALAWATNLQDEAMKRQALDEITKDMAREDPTRAAELALSEFGDKIPYEAASNIAGQLAVDNPQSALDFVGNLAEENVRAEAMEQIVRQWAKDDISEVGAFLNDQPASPEMDKAVAAFASAAYKQDPVTAMDWASSITEPRRRAATVGKLYFDWRRNDKEAANSWVQQNGGEENVWKMLRSGRSGKGR